MAAAATDMTVRPLDTQADRRGCRDMLAWHRYVTTVEVDGQRRNVMLSVRERPDGTFHYSPHRERDGAGAGS